MRHRCRAIRIVVVIGSFLLIRQFHIILPINDQTSINMVRDTSSSTALNLKALVFHSSNIGQVLKTIFDAPSIAAHQKFDWNSILSALRNMSHIDLPACRPGVTFTLLLIFSVDILPRYIQHFLSTASRNPTIDVLILASAQNCVELRSQWGKKNIHITCVSQDVIYFFITDGLCSEWICKPYEFYETFKHIKRKLSISPYRLVDLKPMLASIFRNYLSCYSHWAFCDVDLLLGNFNKLYPTAFARHYDIITFPHALDQEVFLRGQLTIFKNIPAMISLWTKIKRFSSSTAFFETMKNNRWKNEPIDECEFSVAAMSDQNITWIQLPGLHAQDRLLLQSKAEITVSADTPPSLTVQRTASATSGFDHTVFEKSILWNLTKAQILSGAACWTQNWIPLDERRCINITRLVPQGHGTIVMRRKAHKEITTAFVPVSTKEYMFFHHQFSKMSIKWHEIPLDRAFRINVTGVLKST